MRGIRYLVSAVALTTAAIGLVACSGGGSSSIGNGGSSGPSGHEEHGGTVTMAWPASPNFVFPLVPVTNEDGYNANLSQPMWPELVYAGDGANATVNPQESLYSSLTYGNGDKTITIVLKPWKWSDGTPITARDFTFVYNIIKANKANWAGYVQGLFPDDVASVATPQGPSGHTIVLNLTKAYNAAF
jgi:peptide/nickel transport system substrate-binding protein